MYLVADNPALDVGTEDVASHSRWESFPVSELSHHNQPCCEIARHWFRAMDFAQLNGGDPMSGPRWIRQKFEWGPSRWPLHWCEALKAKVIDCGAHAALAHQAFDARGLTALRAQVVQSYDSRAVDQWRTRWDSDDASDHWLGDGFIYHEANAVLVAADEVKIWDGSSACWLNPGHGKGYGGALAVRLMAAGSQVEASTLRWGDRRLCVGKWQQLRA